MAALAGAQIDLRKEEGSGQRASFYLFHNVTSNDTVDLSARFSRIVAAAMIGSTAVVAVNALTIAGAVLTFNPAGLVNDDVFVLVVGAGLV